VTLFGNNLLQHGDDARGIIRRPAPDRDGRVHRAYGLWNPLLMK
jgi:hypothetical protein